MPLLRHIFCVPLMKRIYDVIKRSPQPVNLDQIIARVARYNQHLKKAQLVLEVQQSLEKGLKSNYFERSNNQGYTLKDGGIYTRKRKYCKHILQKVYNYLDLLQQDFLTYAFYGYTVVLLKRATEMLMNDHMLCGVYTLPEEID